MPKDISGRAQSRKPPRYCPNAHAAQNSTEIQRKAQLGIPACAHFSGCSYRMMHEKSRFCLHRMAQHQLAICSLSSERTYYSCMLPCGFIKDRSLYHSSGVRTCRQYLLMLAIVPKRCRAHNRQCLLCLEHRMSGQCQDGDAQPISQTFCWYRVATFTDKEPMFSVTTL